jgi:hypothetical protein
MLAFHVVQGSADGRRRVSGRDGKMTDISLQKTAKTAKATNSDTGEHRPSAPAASP